MYRDYEYTNHFKDMLNDYVQRIPKQQVLIREKLVLSFSCTIWPGQHYVSKKN